MLIDLILDRKDGKNVVVKDGKCYTTSQYDAKRFYNNIEEYNQVFDGIHNDLLMALDSGVNKDIQRELNIYIVKENYNPDIIKYINSVD
jgi:rRNA pseudouridine-1189 N-methylase Emg1 (Nep1/Mra1 family)